MAVQVSVDRSVCMGSGNCVYWAPALFDMDDDGFPVLIADPHAHAEAAALAADNCPTRAISVSTDPA